MAQFELSVCVERPADEVFAFMTDVDRQPDWQRGVLSSQHARAGPHHVGTQFEKGRRTPMGRVRFVDEIMAWDPEVHTWTEQVVSGMVRGSGSRGRFVRRGRNARPN